MKIVFLDADTLGATPTSEFASLGEFVSYPTSTREEALARVGNCDTLIINKIIVDAALMDAAPNLKLICVTATGVNNIDLVEAEKRGIAVRNVSGYSTDSVVQSTFAHLLSLLGDSPYFDDCVKSGRYSSMSIFCDISHPYTEIVGKTLGIIGLGAIGKRVAAIAGMFGMKVIYYSTSGTSHCKLYPSVSLDELLESSDVVSIHAPLNERTRSLIGQAQLAKMKKSALLLNLGRGGIVDEEALAFAVDNGVIAGAALDVFEKEPLPATSPLLHLRHPERFRFSPHTAWASREALARLVSKVADNIRNFYGLQA
ncbi:MAG: D-2-hydroxyacid dehydrogenase [Bacteroidales bacterium]|nr:D-2-hydroxyacid dehydrogenase [Bacteroidales bacterium]